MNKVWLITGCSTGFGRALAKEVLAKGYSAAVAARNTNDVQDIIADYPATAIAVKLDVTVPEQIESAVKATIEQFGQIDVLVNNAGITRDATLRKLTKPNWDAVLRTNLDSVFHATKPFLDGMVARGWGRIINISSINGLKGQFGQTNYSAAKAGMHGFTKALAQEVARKGVTVNTISPGYLATKMVMAVPEEVRKQIEAGIPVGRLGQPAEIAALVTFVASDAAAFMTGSNLSMNGGQHMY